jgi:hypothetical protein
MIGLLLALLAIGLIAYFMLKPAHNGVGDTDTGRAISCEHRVSDIVSSTGGIGPKAKEAYDALPGECKRFMPDPAAIAPSVEKVPEQQ